MSRLGYIKDGRYIKESPTADVIQPREHSGHREFVRSHMADTYRRDLIQRYEGGKLNPQFVQEYPEQAKRQHPEKEINAALTEAEL